MSLIKHTKIPLLNNVELTLEEISKIYTQEQLYVYCCDNENNIKPGLITGFSELNLTNLFKVHLDDGSYFIASEEQLVVLRDGSCKCVKDLQEEDSLMPLYRKLSSEKGMIGYEKVFNPSSKKYRFTHRIVAAAFSPNNIYEGVVHHKNFNKLNNHPLNLEIMTWEEHTQLHMNEYIKLNEYAKSEKGRQKSRELMTALERSRMEN